MPPWASSPSPSRTDSGALQRLASRQPTLAPGDRLERRRSSDAGSAHSSPRGGGGEATAVRQLRDHWKAASYGSDRAGQSPHVLFDKLDADGSGYLTRTQWIQGVKRLGKSRMGDHEAGALFERVDADNDQRVDYHELLAFVWDGVDPHDDGHGDSDDDDEIVDDGYSPRPSEDYNSHSRRHSVSSRRSGGGGRSPRPRPELDRRSSIADSDVTMGGHAAVGDWERRNRTVDDAAAADSMRHFDSGGGTTLLPHESQDGASGWATSPVYQQQQQQLSPRDYSRQQRRERRQRRRQQEEEEQRYNDAARYGSGGGGRGGGGGGASVDSDNYSSSASDTGRGSGSETETEFSPLRRRGEQQQQQYSPRRHRRGGGGGGSRSRSPEVSRAEATRRNSTSTYRGGGVRGAYGGGYDGLEYGGGYGDEEETMYLGGTASLGKTPHTHLLNVNVIILSSRQARDEHMDTLTNNTLSPGGGGSDGGVGGGGGGGGSVRAPHWTEKTSQTHDRHVMARASEHHVRKPLSFCHFILNMYHFAKTGSGQT